MGDGSIDYLLNIHLNVGVVGLAWLVGKKISRFHRTYRYLKYLKKPPPLQKGGWHGWWVADF